MRSTENLGLRDVAGTTSTVMRTILATTLRSAKKRRKPTLTIKTLMKLAIRNTRELVMSESVLTNTLSVKLMLISLTRNLRRNVDVAIVRLARN
jgi:hypothetical protein